MADIFISYAREDLERVTSLAKSLGERGWTVWWDRKIPAGKVFNQVITDALNNARCIIVVWSSPSVKSPWVYDEADVGKNRKILIPVLIEAVSPPMGFRNIQSANLIDWDRTKTSPPFKKLVDDIASLIGTETESSRKEPETPQTENPPGPIGLSKSHSLLKIGVCTAIAAIILAIALVFVGFNRGPETSSPPDPPLQNISAQIYSHQRGFTLSDAETLKHALEEK